MEHSGDAEGAVKHITVGLILSWIVGVVLIIGGLGFVASDPAGGALVLIGGLIMLPPVSGLIRRKTHVHLSGGVRFLIALVLFALGIWMTTGTVVNSVREKAAGAQTAVSAVNTAPASGSERLELLSYRCSVEYGYFKITGQVKNISGKSMENVMAVGSLFTDQGEFVKSSDALIDYNPILANQTSPFQTITTTNPEATKCQVEFKEMFGGTIATKKAVQD